MRLRDIIGHRRLTTLVARAVARGSVPPTLLLAGPSGVGKWAVARAVAQEAAVMLLDEPVAALDLAHQLAVCELLVERAREGVAVVVVLHDLNLAARCCDRLLVLCDGEASVAPVVDFVTAARVRAVFDVEAHIGVCPGDGRPFAVAWRRTT